MKAIILAAGQGTRLKKYTQNLPKGMLEFNGRTIIERQIELYRECGIDDIIIIKGYAADKIKYDDIKYYVNEAYAETNMVETLMCAKEEFNSDIIVSYSDILFDKYMLEEMIKSKVDYGVAVDINWQKYWFERYGDINFDTESLKMDNNKNIIELGRENPKLEEIDARYIGLLKFSSKGLEKILDILQKAYENYKNKPWMQSGKVVKKAYMTDLLQALIKNNEQVKAIEFNNGWVEFDTNEDYEKAIEWLDSGIIKKFLKADNL